jgi:SpoVK/Ycf46/Vps4 family AAA+-type ATPase
MDKREEIIALQNRIIKTMTADKLRGVGNDLWGISPAPRQKAPETPVSPSLDELRAEVEKSARELERMSDALKTPSGTGALPQGRLDAPSAKASPDKKSGAEAGEKTGEKPEDKPEEKPKTIEELKKELHEYIGLDVIKAEVDSLINYVTIMKKRKDAGLPTPELSLHMVFSGNPGTGKTMIARLMARVYKALHILSKGQLVETDRSGLVAGYVGQTALKTQEVIEKAKGGVLFIDEAYALTSRGEKDFGQEAVDTLLKTMEDNRDDLIVIVAGYTELMRDFVNSNPGLKSRFNRFLDFPDYTVDEMMRIFDMRCEKSGYSLKDGAARDALKARVEAGSRDTRGFGNARGVRNLFERALSRQADRLAGMEQLTRDDLMTLTREDLEKA